MSWFCRITTTSTIKVASAIRSLKLLPCNFYVTFMHLNELLLICDMWLNKITYLLCPVVVVVVVVVVVLFFRAHSSCSM